MIIKQDNRQASKIDIQQLQKGFTIIEVMVSLVLVAIGIATFATLQAFFANDTKNRFIYGCLITTASNGIAMCMDGETLPSSVQCGGIQVNLSMNGTCSPPINGCSQITATASYNHLSYSESDNVCF